MLNIDMLNDPRNWTTNTEWSNFFWINNALGIFKIISDRLLFKLTPELIELYRSNGYYFSSSNAISVLEKFDNYNLLLDREFSTSIWLVVDNYENSTNEKLNVILNKEKFSMTFTDHADIAETIEIPYYVQESSALIELNEQLNIIRINIDQSKLAYKESGLTADEIKGKLELVELGYNDIYNQYIQEKNRLEEQINQVIDIGFWGNKIKKMLSAELPDLDNNTIKGRMYHVIEVGFSGIIKTDVTTKIN